MSHADPVPTSVAGPLRRRTFAPAWELFKGSTEKLAACHMELVRKLQELIKDVHKYVDEQAKAHKKVSADRRSAG